MSSPKIVVVGSCNIDFSTYVPHLPKPGETLYASKLAITNGGKGANQCVAAARLGASTTMVGRLGDDAFGKRYFNDLETNGVDTSFLAITENTCSGTAVITVAENGENQIVIVPGANGKMTKKDIMKATLAIQKADVVVFQFEIPLDAIMEGLRIASKGKCKSIVNVAPAIPNIDKNVFKLADILCINEIEAEILTNVPVNSVADANVAIQNLLEQGCNTVVLTLGAQGAVYASEKEPTPVHIVAQKVDTVDTTGAGDAFIGAMAYYFSYHPQLTLRENITRSCRIAAITAKTAGAQPSYPWQKDLPKNLFL